MSKRISIDKLLLEASKAQKVETIGFLLDKGANATAKNRLGETALHFVAGWGHPDLLARLISMGADINAVTKYGQAPLHIAAQYGHVPAAATLIDEGAQMVAPGTESVTPLHIAAIYGHSKMVEFLLSQNADVEARACNRDTALHRAAQMGHDEICGLLINAGCDNAIENNEGKTAIQCVEVEWGGRHLRTWGILLAAADRRSIEAAIAEPAMACRGRRI
jgi:ankyrin repeat protein